MCSWPNRRFSHAEASCRDKRPPRGSGGALPCDDGFQNKGLQRPIMADLKGLAMAMRRLQRGDRKSTRLNSSHSQISYAVFCLKKKKKNKKKKIQQQNTAHKEEVLSCTTSG